MIPKNFSEIVRAPINWIENKVKKKKNTGMRRYHTHSSTLIRAQLWKLSAQKEEENSFKYTIKWCVNKEYYLCYWTLIKIFRPTSRTPPPTLPAHQSSKTHHGARKYIRAENRHSRLTRLCLFHGLFSSPPLHAPIFPALRKVYSSSQSSLAPRPY